MNSSIIARLQRKLRKFSENPLSGFRVSDLRSQLQCPRSWVPPINGSQVLDLGPHLQDPGSCVMGPTYEMGPGFKPMRWVLGLGSQVPPTVPGLASQFKDMPFKELFESLLFCHSIIFYSILSKVLLFIYREIFLTSTSILLLFFLFLLQKGVAIFRELSLFS